MTFSEDEIRRVGYRVVDLIAKHLAELPSAPVFRPVPADLAASFRDEPLPLEGESADAILDDFARRIAPYPFGNGHPRFHGWINAPPAVMGIFGDALAAAMNPSCAGGNHAAIHVERQVVRWMAELLGLPSGTMGLLVSGGSMAAAVALGAARHARAGFDVRREGLAAGRSLRVYKSAEGHGCHEKAVELLGLGSASLRRVPVDASLRIDPRALDALIAEDAAAGHVPVAVVATAGTVNTGAIDPLGAIADVCVRHGVWFHVDGAYGAPAVLTAEYRDELAPIARADSVAADPHKWLYVPVACGLVFVRDGATMRDAFSLVPAYLRTEGAVGGVSDGPWMSEYGIEQTRAFRALKLWMALRHRGVAGYRRAIEHDIAMARVLAARLREAHDFEVREPQELSIVAFRHLPAALRGDEVAVDAHNRALVERVQLGGRSFVSSTTVEGRFYLRACIVNPHTAESDVSALLDAVRDAGSAT
jgi:aromatic-L-amino-acid/L-tryptophan decarboxylase